MKIYIVDGNYQYTNLFVSRGWEVCSKMEDADLILFTGGEDVSPDMYGEQRHPSTYSNRHRDDKEAALYGTAILLNIPMVGICRGGQFLNVINGGKMYQHVGGHCRDHYLTDVDTGKEVLVSSTHHQMMRPAPGATVIATAAEYSFKQCMIDGIIVDVDDPVDVEVVYYAETNCLCFQPHPEFTDDRYKGMTDYFFSLLDDLLLKD